MSNAMTLRDTIRMGQFHTNTSLVDPFRSLAEHGKVQQPMEPRIEEQNNNNENDHTLNAGGYGKGGDSRFEDHPLLAKSPSFSSNDAINSQLPNIVPHEILEQVIDGRGSMPVAQLKLEMENQLRAEMQKKLQPGLSNYSTPKLGR
ncbi:hypothetical protein BH10PSE19_BH10PSE19_05220 [soil metagenome]